ncbi:hypothetical protein AALB52_24995, partial [Lachnospiraceae bacterium 38-14]
MLAFSNDYYGMIFRATQSVELFCAYIISAMQKAIGMNIEQTKKVFLTISLFAHGYASIIANNSLKYDEELIKTHLERAYRGAILAVQEEMK